jgi:NADH:ubiquinone oxidoreductase subunit
MANLGTIIFTAIFGKKVGEDEFGNKYYKTSAFSNNIGRYGKERRLVIFKGKAEASKIPPYWHGWIHYSIDDVPSEINFKKRYSWQKTHLPNLTGTDHAYLPKGHIKKGGNRDKATGDYQPWQP